MPPFAVNFFIVNQLHQYALRRLAAVPPTGSFVVFNGIRFIVRRVEWCLDDDATLNGTRINIEMEQETDPPQARSA